MRKKVIWFYGLPCSGKTTLANALRDDLEQKGHRICMLDGDVLRTGLNCDLGFSDSDRSENLRRAAHVARLVVDLDHIVIAAFVTPTQHHRALIKQILSSHDLLMVHVDCPLEICIQRDVKGMYAKAKAGQLQNMTGLQHAFEAESENVFVVNTENSSISDLIEEIKNELN
jgi:adenylyl-sulfate kinase